MSDNTNDISKTLDKGKLTGLGYLVGGPAGAAVGALGDFALNWWSKDKEADAAADAARAQKLQKFKQWRHELEGRDLRWDKLNLDHAHLEQVFRDKVRNAEMAADFTDATNDLKYRHQLTIRNREQASLEAQFAKSNALYDEQITANARSARMAEESEWRQLDEIHSEAAFSAQEQRLEYLQAEGKMRASGASGRSAGKVSQAAMASFGFKVAALNEGLASAGRNTKAMLNEIKSDHYSANLAAFANKMLDPGELPMPIKPFKTPRPTFTPPRPLDPIVDKGQEPLLGGYTNPQDAASAVWNTALPSLVDDFANLSSSIYEAWG